MSYNLSPLENYQSGPGSMIKDGNINPSIYKPSALQAPIAMAPPQQRLSWLETVLQPPIAIAPTPEHIHARHEYPPPSSSPEPPVRRQCGRCKCMLPWKFFSMWGSQLRKACDGCTEKRKLAGKRKASSVTPGDRGYRVQKTLSITTTMSYASPRRFSDFESVRAYSPVDGSFMSGINARYRALGFAPAGGPPGELVDLNREKLGKQLNLRLGSTGTQVPQVVLTAPEPSEPPPPLHNENRIISTAFVLADTDPDILRYTPPLRPQTRKQRLEDAITRVSLATRLLEVHNHFRSDKRTKKSAREDFFREMDVLVSLTEKGVLSPWKPLENWFDMYSTKAEGIWNGKRVVADTFEAHRTMRELGNELVVASRLQLTAAETEINVLCRELGVKNGEAEIKRRLAGLKQEVMSETLTAEMVRKAHFLEKWKSDCA